MSKKYTEALGRIQVTEDMRSRILSNISDAEFGKKSILPFEIDKKMWHTAACFALIILIGITVSTVHKNTSNTSVADEENFEITELPTVEDLEKKVGFEVADVTEIPFPVEEESYHSYGEDMAEIIYQGSDQEITYRKSKGTEDNSGDYTEYDNVKEITIGTQTVTIKGDGDSMLGAEWTDEDYSYSMDFSEGLSEDEIEDFLTSNVIAKNQTKETYDNAENEYQTEKEAESTEELYSPQAETAIPTDTPSENEKEKTSETSSNTNKTNSSADGKDEEKEEEQEEQDIRLGEDPATWGPSEETNTEEDNKISNEESLDPDPEDPNTSEADTNKITDSKTESSTDLVSDLIKNSP